MSLVKTARENANLSVTELAEKAGVPTTVIEWLEDQTYRPPLQQRLAVAVALGLDPGDVAAGLPDGGLAALIAAGGGS